MSDYTQALLQAAQSMVNPLRNTAIALDETKNQIAAIQGTFAELARELKSSSEASEKIQIQLIALNNRLLWTNIVIAFGTLIVAGCTIWQATHGD